MHTPHAHRLAHASARDTQCHAQPRARAHTHTHIKCDIKCDPDIGSHANTCARHARVQYAPEGEAPPRRKPESGDTWGSVLRRRPADTLSFGPPRRPRPARAGAPASAARAGRPRAAALSRSTPSPLSDLSPALPAETGAAALLMRRQRAAIGARLRSRAVTVASDSRCSLAESSGFRSSALPWLTDRPARLSPNQGRACVLSGTLRVFWEENIGCPGCAGGLDLRG